MTVSGYNFIVTSLLLVLIAVFLDLGVGYVLDHGDGEGEDVVPHFLPSPTNITVHEGDLAVLKCRIANLGPKMVNVVVWRRTSLDYPLTIGELSFTQNEEMSVDHSQLSADTSSWDLLIKDVKPEHAGVYECQVTANHLIARYVTLNVMENSQVKPELTITGNNFVNMGSELHLICNATGQYRAPDAVDWFKDGQRIHPSNERWSGRIEVAKYESFQGKYYVSELLIEHSRMNDSGHYVCRSTDLAVSSIKVHVLNADVSRKEKDAQSQSIKTEPANAGCMALAHITPILTILILVLSWR